MKANMKRFFWGEEEEEGRLGMRMSLALPRERKRDEKTPAVICRARLRAFEITLIIGTDLSVHV